VVFFAAGLAAAVVFRAAGFAAGLAAVVFVAVLAVVFFTVAAGFLAAVDRAAGFRAVAIHRTSR
jgi:hypothetical protein